MASPFDDMKPGIHAFDQGVDAAGNHTFGIAIIPTDDERPVETFVFAGRIGMTEAEAAAEFESIHFPAPPSDQEVATIAAKERKEATSAECRRRIYAVASAETQMNMAAASAVISSKTASARSDKEKAVLMGLEAAIVWVSAMRANIAPLAADTAKDITSDSNWPDVPPAAAAIAAQF